MLESAYLYYPQNISCLCLACTILASKHMFRKASMRNWFLLIWNTRWPKPSSRPMLHTLFYGGNSYSQRLSYEHVFSCTITNNNLVNTCLQTYTSWFPLGTGSHNPTAAESPEGSRSYRVTNDCRKTNSNCNEFRKLCWSVNVWYIKD